MQVYISNSPAETLALGEKIGKELRPSRVVLLYGELGSGKTLFTRGLARGLGIEDPGMVRSPSFTLVNEYPARECTIYHVDLYRLEGLRDLYSIDLEEILASQSIVVIEWAEKLLFSPPHPLKIRILVDPETEQRRFEVHRGDWQNRTFR